MNGTEVQGGAPYRLVRPLDRRMIGGVAAGVGDYLGIDPILVRGAFLVLAFVGGIGIFLYMLAWLMTPAVGGRRAEAGTRPRRRERLLRWIRNRPAWVGLILLLAGIPLVFREFGLWRPALFWGAALVALGVMLFRSDTSRFGPPPGSETAVQGPTTPPPPAPASGPARFSGGVASPRERRWLLRPRVATPFVPRPPREHSALGWLTLGAALLAVGIAAGLDRAAVVTMQPVRYVALALGVLGLGLVVGAWLGRARWLAVPGILLIPFVLVTSLIDVPLQGGYGTRYRTPATTADLPPAYRLGAGTMSIDLSGLLLQSTPAVVTASVGVGTLDVTVPEGVEIDVHAHAGGGDLYLVGEHYAGIDVRTDRTFGQSLGAPPIVLNLAVGIGRIDVYQIPPPALSG